MFFPPLNGMNSLTDGRQRSQGTIPVLWLNKTNNRSQINAREERAWSPNAEGGLCVLGCNTATEGPSLTACFQVCSLKRASHNFLEAIAKLLPHQRFNFCRHLGRGVTVKDSVLRDSLGLVAARAMQTQGNCCTTELSLLQIWSFSGKKPFFEIRIAPLKQVLSYWHLNTLLWIRNLFIVQIKPRLSCSCLNTQQHEPEQVRTAHWLRFNHFRLQLLKWGDHTTLLLTAACHHNLFRDQEGQDWCYWYPRVLSILQCCHLRIKLDVEL